MLTREQGGGLFAVLIAGWTNPYIQRGTTSLAWLGVNVVLWVSEANVWRHSRAGATKAGEGNLWIPLTCLVPGFAVFFLAPTIVPSADIRPAGVAFALGITILVAGLVLRSWAMRTLGRYFAGVVATRADEPVIISGPLPDRAPPRLQRRPPRRHRSRHRLGQLGSGWPASCSPSPSATASASKKRPFWPPSRTPTPPTPQATSD
jgi:hypothetical protein